MARIPYVREEEAAPEAAAALRAVRERRGTVSAVQSVLAHSVSALQAYERFANDVGKMSALDARTQEIVILRTAQLLGNAYAWRRHVPKGLEAGLTSDQLASIAAWRPSSAFAPRERAILQLVDEPLGWRETAATTICAVREH